MGFNMMVELFSDYSLKKLRHLNITDLPSSPVFTGILPPCAIGMHKYQYFTLMTK